jgi:hypothetical protein
MGGQVMGRKGVNILGESVIAGLGIHPDSAQEGCAVAAGPDEVERDDGPEECGNVSAVTPCLTVCSSITRLAPRRRKSASDTTIM